MGQAHLRVSERGRDVENVRWLVELSRGGSGRQAKDQQQLVIVGNVRGELPRQGDEAQSGRGVDLTRAGVVSLLTPLEIGNLGVQPSTATVDRILDDPSILRFCLAAMAEAAAIGTAIGCPIAQSGEDRIAVARKLGAFKTSMLQDVEAGKPVELDALVTVVREIGELAASQRRTLTHAGLARLQARTRGLYA